MDKSTAWKTYYKVSKGIAELSRFFLECDMPKQARDMYVAFDAFEEMFLKAMKETDVPVNMFADIPKENIHED